MNNLVVRRNNAANRWLNPMFEDFFSVPSVFDQKTDTFIPKANITESEGKLIFSFEVPGINKEDIQVTITNRVLSIKGRRELCIGSEKENLVRQEIISGDFERQFTLPGTIHTDDIQAKYSNGILTIELEKKEVVKPHQVNVKIK